MGLAAAVLVAYLSIVRLRTDRENLATETANAEVENQQLLERMSASRGELERTETSLSQQSAALASLRHALAEGHKEYQGIIDAKEKALRDADVATQKLVGLLGESRSERDIAE